MQINGPPVKGLSRVEVRAFFLGINQGCLIASIQRDCLCVISLLSWIERRSNGCRATPSTVTTFRSSSKTDAITGKLF